MLPTAWTFALIAALVAQESPASAPTSEQIARAIEDLAAPRFEEREAATELLWKAGQAAETALVQAAKSTDPEVRTRAAALLNRLRLGIRPDTPPEVLALIDQFRYASAADQRRQALNELQTKGHWQTVLTLIRGEQNPQERRNLATALAAEAGKIASALVDRGELAQAQEILELVAATEAGLPQLTAFLLLTDRLDQQIAVARERTSEQPKDEHWTRLSYLLRTKGDLSGAIEAAANTPDLVLRTNLMAEAQRWDEAAAFAEDLYHRNPGRLEPAAFAATYYRLAGNGAEHERVAKALLKAANVERLKEQEIPNNPFAPPVSSIAQNNLWTAAETLLINERIEEALPILRKTNPRFAHMVYWRQHRNREALEFVGVPDDARLDRAWFDKLPTPVAGPQWSAVTDTTMQQELRLTLAAQVARELRELGRHEQVEQIRQTLQALDAPANDRGRRLMTLATLWWQLGKYDDAARDTAAAISAGLAPAAMFSSLLRQQGPLAAFWYEQWTAADANADRAQMAARALWLVTPQPRRGKAPDDWRQLVAAAQAEAQRQSGQTKAQRLSLIGQTCRIRGDMDLARQCFTEAAEMEPAMGIAAGDLALADGNWPLAAKYYGAARSANSSPLLIYLDGYALTKTGASEAGAKQLRLANIMALAPEVRLAVAAGLSERGLKKEAVEQAEMVRRTALPDSPQAAGAAQTIGNVLNMGEPLKAAECWNYLCLHVLNPSNFNENEAYLSVPQRIHLARAKAAMSAGEATKAAAELELCDKLLPGDVRTIVELVPQLNRAGMAAVADEFFERGWSLHQRVIEEFPQSAMHLNNTAWIGARAQRKLDEALALAQKAVELAPEEAAYHDTLAEVCFQRGDREGAVAAAQKCVELAPDNKLFATRLKHFQEDELKSLDGVEAE